MTQKEYKEEIEKYKKMLQEAEDRLQKEISKNYDYETCLKNYYVVSEQLNDERRYNTLNIEKIDEQQKIIEKYEKILDKFTINY